MALKNMIANTGKLMAGAGKGAGKLSEKFDELMLVALKIVVISVAIAAVHKYATLKTGADMQAWYIYFGLGVAAVGLEYYGSQMLVDGYYDRAVGGMAIGAMLCLPALAFSYSNAIGSAAVQQSEAAGLQKANFRKTKNTESTVKESEFSLKTAQEARSKLTPLRSAADARAAIDSAQAHKWWAYTDSCSKPKGKESRAWCDKYRSAQADIKMWDDISVQDARIDALQAKLAEARDAESEAPTTVSEVRADTLEYAAWFGTNAEGGQTMQTRHVALTITMFVTMMGFATAWRRNRGRELKPWGFWLSLKKKFYRIWEGDESLAYGRDTQVIKQYTTITDTPFARAARNGLAQLNAGGAQLA